MKSTSLDDLTAIALKFRDERDWKQFHSPKELAIQLILESAELLELMQWRHGDDLAAHVEKKRAQVEEELADILHGVVLIAADLKIDLAAAFKSKMQKNADKYPIHKSKGSPKKYTDF